MPLFPLKLPGNKKTDVADDPTDGQVLTFSDSKDLWDAQDSSTSGSFTTRIPLVMEVPEGSIGFPDINTLATATAKISGMVLPDGASVSTINFKCNVPNNLSSTPAASIKFIIMTLGTVTDADVRLTVSTLAVADAASFDQAFTAETEQTIRISRVNLQP